MVYAPFVQRVDDIRLHRRVFDTMGGRCGIPDTEPVMVLYGRHDHAEFCVFEYLGPLVRILRRRGEIRLGFMSGAPIRPVKGVHVVVHERVSFPLHPFNLGRARTHVRGFLQF